MTATIIGAAALNRKLMGIAAQVPQLGEAALLAEAELIRTASMVNTPVRFGVLKASHRVTSRITAEGPEAAISVGGAAKKYAVVVHETHRTKSKFLENAANAAMEGMSGRLGKRIVAGLGGGL